MDELVDEGRIQIDSYHPLLKPPGVETKEKLNRLGRLTQDGRSWVNLRRKREDLMKATRGFPSLSELDALRTEVNGALRNLLCTRITGQARSRPGSSLHH